MEAKLRFKIVKCEEDKETRIWSGVCTRDEVDRRFNAAIKAQIIKYDVDREPCMLRIYDANGMIIAQETFHRG